MSEEEFWDFGIEVASISPGTIVLGNSYILDTESPLMKKSEITLKKPFKISKHLITQRVFDLVMKEKHFLRPDIITINDELGEDLKTRVPNGPEYPVIFVSWHEAVEFCRILGEMTSCNVKLPTDAQWEYCYRAGTSTEFFWGDDFRDKGLASKFAWFKSTLDKPHFMEVGLLKPNPWGLYDMAGLVQEWVRDSVNMLYPDEALAQPFPEKGVDYYGINGPQGIIRNGPFLMNIGLLSAACKACRDKNNNKGFVGFRIVIEDQS